MVLMDVQMPEMDGFEATATIRVQEQETGKHVKIIAMTAYAMHGDKERCMLAGMDGYITKPINPQQLHQLLADISVSPPRPKLSRMNIPGQLRGVPAKL